MRQFFLFSLISFNFFLWSGSLALASIPSGLSLVGVIADRNEKQSIAVITGANRQTHFLHLGDAIPGLNSYRIQKIHRNHVVVSDGRRELRLEHQGSAATGQSFARNNQLDSFSDDRPSAWNNRRQEVRHRDDFRQDDDTQHYDEADYYDESELDQDYMDIDQTGEARPRQVPGLILRNRGQMHQGRGEVFDDQDEPYVEEFYEVDE